jgi:hypothetical protein
MFIKKMTAVFFSRHSSVGRAWDCSCYQMKFLWSLVRVRLTRVFLAFMSEWLRRQTQVLLDVISSQVRILLKALCHHVRVVKEIDLSSIGSQSAQVRTLLVTPFRFIRLMVRHSYVCERSEFESRINPIFYKRTATFFTAPKMLCRFRLRGFESLHTLLCMYPSGQRL